MRNDGRFSFRIICIIHTKRETLTYLCHCISDVFFSSLLCNRWHARNVIIFPLFYYDDGILSVYL